MPPSFRRFIPRGLRLRSRMRYKKGRWRLATPDRVLLEDVIVPGVLAEQGVRRVLDIGVAWYTRSYPRLFRGVEYHSIDVDPLNARYGGAHHRTLSMTELATVFEPDSFDFVVCNGVFGWGVNSPEQVIAAVDACADVLRPGGWLVVGWNDMDGRRVARLDEELDRRFARTAVPAIGADHLLTQTHYAHRYDFYTRR